eukprot:TRINITY_DN4295_c0_g2_i2.p1 TRINITY_DN4295_c0_g2~~TRINITY_DN4295_c0_g2_i2.p1  ORF type:complete len:1029 (+),score=232.58 TRINITY_DN4295_c0_g2_i2:240-3326(+)
MTSPDTVCEVKLETSSDTAKPPPALHGPSNRHASLHESNCCCLASAESQFHVNCPCFSARSSGPLGCVGIAASISVSAELCSELNSPGGSPLTLDACCGPGPEVQTLSSECRLGNRIGSTLQSALDVDQVTDSDSDSDTPSEVQQSWADQKRDVEWRWHWLQLQIAELERSQRGADLAPNSDSGVASCTARRRSQQLDNITIEHPFAPRTPSPSLLAAAVAPRPPGDDDVDENIEIDIEQIDPEPASATDTGASAVHAPDATSATSDTPAAVVDVPVPVAPPEASASSADGPRPAGQLQQRVPAAVSDGDDSWPSEASVLQQLDSHVLLSFQAAVVKSSVMSYGMAEQQRLFELELAELDRLRAVCASPATPSAAARSSPASSCSTPRSARGASSVSPLGRSKAGGVSFDGSPPAKANSAAAAGTKRRLSQSSDGASPSPQVRRVQELRVSEALRAGAPPPLSVAAATPLTPLAHQPASTVKLQHPSPRLADRKRMRSSTGGSSSSVFDIDQVVVPFSFLHNSPQTAVIPPVHPDIVTPTWHEVPDAPDFSLPSSPRTPRSARTPRLLPFSSPNQQQPPQPSLLSPVAAPPACRCSTATTTDAQPASPCAPCAAASAASSPFACASCSSSVVDGRQPPDAPAASPVSGLDSDAVKLERLADAAAERCQLQQSSHISSSIAASSLAVVAPAAAASLLPACVPDDPPTIAMSDVPPTIAATAILPSTDAGAPVVVASLEAPGPVVDSTPAVVADERAASSRQAPDGDQQQPSVRLADTELAGDSDSDTDSSNDEDTSDEAYCRRHFGCEVLERCRSVCLTAWNLWMYGLFANNCPADVRRTSSNVLQSLQAGARAAGIDCAPFTPAALGSCTIEQLPLHLFSSTGPFRKRRPPSQSVGNPEREVHKMRRKFSRVRARYLNPAKFSRPDNWEPFDEEAARLRQATCVADLSSESEDDMRNAPRGGRTTRDALFNGGANAANPTVPHRPGPGRPRIHPIAPAACSWQVTQLVLEDCNKAPRNIIRLRRVVVA